MSNSITHFEIHGTGPKGLAEFYKSVFGWHIEKAAGVDYWRVETGSADPIHGGLMYPAIAGLNGWIFYIKVDSLDRVVSDIQRLGGKIVRPRTAVPKTGWLTIVADPEGNIFGVWQAER